MTGAWWPSPSSKRLLSRFHGGQGWFDSGPLRSLTLYNAPATLRAVDAITREAIKTLTKRVADLEAGLEVHKTLIKELSQIQHGASFNSAAFDANVTEATLAQRERTALGVEEPVAATPTFVIPLDGPGMT